MADLVKKYKKANRTGCAMLYLGQLSRGDERDEYLDSAINHSGYRLVDILDGMAKGKK